VPTTSIFRVNRQYTDKFNITVSFDALAETCKARMCAFSVHECAMAYWIGAYFHLSGKRLVTCRSWRGRCYCQSCLCTEQFCQQHTFPNDWRTVKSRIRRHYMKMQFAVCMRLCRHTMHKAWLLSGTFRQNHSLDVTCRPGDDFNNIISCTKHFCG